MKFLKREHKKIKAFLIQHKRRTIRTTKKNENCKIKKTQNKTPDKKWTRVSYRSLGPEHVGNFMT